MDKPLTYAFTVLLVAGQIAGHEQHPHVPDPPPPDRVVLEAGPAHVATAMLPPRFF